MNLYQYILKAHAQSTEDYVFRTQATVVQPGPTAHAYIGKRTNPDMNCTTETLPKQNICKEFTYAAYPLLLFPYYHTRQ